MSALPQALIAVDPSLTISFLNPAAELLFATSQDACGKKLSLLMDLTAQEKDMIARVLESSEEVTLYERPLITPHGSYKSTLHVTPVEGGEALLTIEKRSGLSSLTASEWKKEATRSAGVMAAMLAHEVKNPLSGIRGAAQFLKDEVGEEHRSLLDLICTETDRITGLVDQVEIFSAGAPDIQSLNIHEALQYVISVASAGFASHVRFVEHYDPSLPPVSAHRDMLVQLMLNLVKNAGEALAGRKDGIITLTTAYKSGYRIGGSALPIMVTIEDNGPGIDDALREHLFEPFMSTKEKGRGLGLAIVTKIAGDLGAVVELGESARGAKFNVMLAVGSG